jgi:LEA14-like dessication related protein
MPLTARSLLLPCALTLVACASAPKVVKPATPAVVEPGSLEFGDAGLEGFTATLDLQLQSPGTPATVRSVKSELVVEGKVVASKEEPATLVLVPGATGTLPVVYPASYAPRSEDAPRGGSQLVAVRGTVTLDREGFEETLPFARSREIRLPRQPTVSLRSVDGARYAPDNAVFTAYLAVTNPNPFPARIEEVRYKANFGGKEMTEGRVGRAALLAAATTDIYELPVTLSTETYGPEVVQLIKGLVIPYRIEGELVGQGLGVPFTLEGEVRLNPSR